MAIRELTINTLLQLSKISCKIIHIRENGQRISKGMIAPNRFLQAGSLSAALFKIFMQRDFLFK